MNGWVRVYRQLADHPLWTGERFTRGQAWVDLLLMANFTESTAFQGNRPILVKRGQVLTSQVALAARWAWNRKTVRSFLDALKADMMVDIRTAKETDTGYTLITLCNYERFQAQSEEELDIGSAIQPAIRADIERTSNGHPTDTSEEGKKVRREEPPPASGLTMADYLEKFSPEGQEVIRQTVSAIASTRKAGKVAESVLNALARKLSKYPQSIVLQACRTYLAKDCAGQGKGEQYLLGIVRNEARRQNGDGRESASTGRGPVDTCGRPLPYIGRSRQDGSDG